MFEVGFTEILVIAALALIVLGPEKLPRVAAQVGRWMGRARSMARQFREQLEDEVQVVESTKTKPSPSSSSTSSTAGAAGAAGAASETAEPAMYNDIGSPGVTPPPEVSAAEAAAAETAHAENASAPPPEPEPDPSIYQAPAYSSSAATGSEFDNPESGSRDASAATPSAVESPPSQHDDEPPRKAGDFITTTHERGI
jgi:sec-independent protein translocase protein TatB